MSAARVGRLPGNWRDLLPDSASFYAGRLQKLKPAGGGGWAQARCPFHDDSNASFSVKLGDYNGAWKCFAGCGAGDMVSFHMRQTGLTFAEAARALIRGEF